MPQDYSSQTCPICESSTFKPTADTFDLANILERWESEYKVGTFSETVWQEYTLPTSRRVTLYHCNNCGFGMFRPVLAGSPDFYKTVMTYERRTVLAEKWEFLQAIREKWELLQAIRDLKKHRSHRILDVGCGSGYFLDLLRDRLPSVDYAGYELNSEMSELARSKGHKVYHRSFPEAVLAENKDESFDAICMFQVLEHLPDPVAALKGARRLLSPRGILIIGVPDAEGPARHFPSALTNMPPHHVSRWCASTFRIGVPRLGFRVLRVAREPLPSYLWDSYLPVMIENSIQRTMIGKVQAQIIDKILEVKGKDLDARRVIGAKVRIYITNPLVRILSWFGFRWLWGVPGPHMYVVLQREDGGR